MTTSTSTGINTESGATENLAPAHSGSRLRDLDRQLYIAGLERDMDNLLKCIRDKNAQLDAWKREHPDSRLMDVVGTFEDGTPKLKIDTISEESTYIPSSASQESRRKMPKASTVRMAGLLLCLVLAAIYVTMQ